eukprot:6478213-Amphidinium_carterae.1
MSMGGDGLMACLRRSSNECSSGGAKPSGGQCGGGRSRHWRGGQNACNGNRILLICPKCHLGRPRKSAH